MPPPFLLLLLLQQQQQHNMFHGVPLLQHDWGLPASCSWCEYALVSAQISADNSTLT
jgi:hypothetical protein